MITHIIEATQSVERGFNHGKFMVCQWESKDWEYPCTLESELGRNRSLLRKCGWGPSHIWVLDLQTGEGACFRHGGFADNDLDRHKVWVCPMFLEFLRWVYKQDLSDLTKLPHLVELPNAEAAMYGYRRSGPAEADEKAV